MIGEYPQLRDSCQYINEYENNQEKNTRKLVNVFALLQDGRTLENSG